MVQSASKKLTSPQIAEVVWLAYDSLYYVSEDGGTTCEPDTQEAQFERGAPPENQLRRIPIAQVILGTKANAIASIRHVTLPLP